MQLESSHYLVSRAERSRDSRADRSTDSGADSCTDSRTDRQGQTGRQAGAEAGGEHDVPAAVEVAVHAVRHEDRAHHHVAGALVQLLEDELDGVLHVFGPGALAGKEQMFKAGDDELRVVCEDRAVHEPVLKGVAAIDDADAGD